jgi:hypothetical protein
MFLESHAMAFEKLVIFQHGDIMWYATIHEGRYQPQIQKYNPRDYVYLQQIVPMALDVTTRHVILKVKKVVPSRTLIIEVKMTWCERIMSIVVHLVIFHTLMEN